MNERPTPETDALFYRNGYPVEVDSSKAMQLCEKLEQERDEARNKMADALQEVDLRNLDFERMKRERDEARHDFEEQSEVVRNLKIALEEVSKLARTLKQERDEARDQAQRLRVQLNITRKQMRWHARWEVK